jgi:hypothetical protein
VHGVARASAPDAYRLDAGNRGLSFCRQPPRARPCGKRIRITVDDERARSLHARIVSRRHDDLGPDSRRISAADGQDGLHV